MRKLGFFLKQMLLWPSISFVGMLGFMVATAYGMFEDSQLHKMVAFMAAAVFNQLVTTKCIIVSKKLMKELESKLDELLKDVIGGKS